MIPQNKHVVLVMVWGALQCAILALGAAGVPLWAHHPLPRESFGLEEMLCGQTLIVALLPGILPSTGWVIATALAFMAPMDELAGLLSNASQPVIARGFLCVAIWSLGLSTLSRCLGAHHQLKVSAGTTLYIIGGAVLDYLHSETLAIRAQAGLRPLDDFLGMLCLSSRQPMPLVWAASAIPWAAAAIFTAGNLVHLNIGKPSYSTSLHR